MEVANIEEYLRLLPVLKESPGKFLWSSYDAEADTLYINFKKPSHATDSDLTDDDVIVRYEDGEIVGLNNPSREQALKDWPQPMTTTRHRLDQYCANLDREIDRLVYELYELTDDEIAIVEGSQVSG